MQGALVKYEYGITDSIKSVVLEEMLSQSGFVISNVYSGGALYSGPSYFTVVNKNGCEKGDLQEELNMALADLCSAETLKIVRKHNDEVTHKRLKKWRFCQGEYIDEPLSDRDFIAEFLFSSNGCRYFEIIGIYDSIERANRILQMLTER